MALAQEFVETGIGAREIGHAIMDRVTLTGRHALYEPPFLIVDAIVARHELDAGHVDLGAPTKNLIASCRDTDVDYTSDCR